MVETKKIAFKNFVIAKTSENGKYKNLIYDIKNDSNLPIHKSYNDIIQYIDFQTMMGETNDIFQDFLTEFKVYYKNTPKEELEDTITSWLTVFSSEKWDNIKDNFPIGMVYLIGKPNDIYKMYCVDTQSKKALRFDLKSKLDFNNLTILDEDQIHVGDLTERLTVSEAMAVLENCTYENAINPNEESFSEIMFFLEWNR